MNTRPGITREFAGHESHRKRLEPNEKEIGNQMPCKIVEMWKQACKAWYSVALNALEELYNLMPRRIADLIKQIKVQRNTDFMM